jgi:hypothetical protein
MDHVRRLNILRSEVANADSRPLSTAEKREIAKLTGTEYKPVDTAANVAKHAGYLPDTANSNAQREILGYSIKTPTSRDEVSLHSYNSGNRALDVDDNTAYLRGLTKSRIAQANKCREAHDLRNTSKRKLNEYNTLSQKFETDWRTTWVDALADTNTEDTEDTEQ